MAPRTFEGTLTALATPFRGGLLDEDAYRAFVQWQIAEGVEGIVSMGTTGEAVTMSTEEQLRAVTLSVEAAGGKVPVVAGAGSNNTAETVRMVGRVRDAGADGALIVTPYYNKPMQAGLVEHFKAIAKGHPGFPLIAYNVPGRTGGDLLPSTCLKLCDIPEVVALKEATASMIRALEVAELCGKRLTLLSGDDFTVAPFMACGGRGVISVSSNVAPRMMGDIVRAGLKGDFEAARALQLKMAPLHRALFTESNPIPVKAALTMMEKFSPELRLPLTPLSEKFRPELKQALVSLGVLG